MRRTGVILAALATAFLGLRWFSYVYAVGTVLRFGQTTGGRIPIFFHWVLAAYCYVWSRFHPRAVPA